MFHVKEHKFTISKIKSHLNELGLFLGFEDKLIIEKFKEVHNDKVDLYNLDKWEVFEKIIKEYLLVCINFGVLIQNNINYLLFSKYLRASSIPLLK